jgi:CheY-like chemotaxis protein
MNSSSSRIIFVACDAEYLTFLNRLFLACHFANEETLSLRAEFVSNIDQASSMAMEERFDFAVTDDEVPLHAGIKFLRSLTEHRPETHKIMLSECSDPKIEQLFLNAGATLVIPKPHNELEFHFLYRAIGDLLNSDRKRDGFSGTLEAMRMLDMIQMLCLAQATLRVQVKTHAAAGIIDLCEGQIWHAQYGNLAGEEALYSLLNLPGGKFSTELRPPSSPRTIHQSSDLLLMESARRKDEDQISAFEAASQSQRLSEIMKKGAAARRISQSLPPFHRPGTVREDSAREDSAEVVGASASAHDVEASHGPSPTFAVSHGTPPGAKESEFITKYVQIGNAAEPSPDHSSDPEP